MKWARPEISVIVLNWNGKNWLKKCFDSLKNQTFRDFEVILVDNASFDGSVEYIKKHFSWVKLIQHKENLGYAKANNNAVKNTLGKYLFFLNCDTWLDKNCLRNLWEQTERKEGIFAPQQMSYDQKKFLSCGMGCDIFGYPGSKREGRKPFYADGAALFVKKDLFNILGMFDEKTFFSYEDADLSWRALLLGYDIIPVPQAVVYHEIGATLTGGDIKDKGYSTAIWRRYLGERNNLRNILKNYHFLTLLWILPLYLSINLTEIILFLVTGRLKVIRDCYLKAWWYNIINFGDTWRWHRRIRSKRKVNDWQILKRMEWKVEKLAVFKRVGIPQFR